MTGNISKAKGFRGEDGKDGHTPSVEFRYEESTGNLYYCSDGILLDKEYVSSQGLVSSDDFNKAIYSINKTFEATEKTDNKVTTITANTKDDGTYPSAFAVLTFHKLNMMPIEADISSLKSRCKNIEDTASAQGTKISTIEATIGNIETLLGGI